MAKIAPEIQDVAHTVGDSLKLAFRAQYAEADLLVFSDVNFMAETAKILAPTKTVLVTVLEATYPVTRHTPSTAGEAKPALLKVLRPRSWLPRPLSGRVS